MPSPLKRLEYIHRSLTEEGNRSLFRGYALWRERAKKRKHWLATSDMEPRTREVLACPDLKSIPTVPGAGELHDGVLTMHNGLKVLSGSYSGDPMTNLLSRTKGIHEPQEEKVFAEVLKYIPPGSAMLELGAWWGFYSMWFRKEVADGRLFLIEPFADNLAFGEKNLALNGMSATFLQAFIDVTSHREGDQTPFVCIDDALAQFGIDRLAILHCDIQGYEAAMLRGAAKSIAARKIDYFFLSSHCTNLHYECLDLLRSEDYEILAHADMLDTYSFDGLIVGRRKELKGCPPVPIALR